MIAYNNNGQLVTLASGQRMWIGTSAAHEAAIQAGTMPNNCTVAIIDEAQIDATPTDAITNGDMHPVTSNAVYDALPKFNNVVITKSYTCAALAPVEIITDIPWSDDIVIIPRWLGADSMVMTNYYAYSGTNNVAIVIQNTTNSALTITNAAIHLAVIRSNNTWHNL